MWIFGKRAFLSAVAYDARKDFDKTSPFPKIAPRKGTHVLVRARAPEHLEDLKRIVPNLVTHDDKSADYRYRAVVKRKLFKKYLQLLVDDIDYDSHFKEVVRRNQPQRIASAMYSAMMTTWGAMNRIQHEPAAPRATTVQGPEGSISWTPRMSRTELKNNAEEGKWNLDHTGQLLISKGRATATPEETAQMSSDGFELLILLQERHGAGSPITPGQVASATARIKEGASR